MANIINVKGHPGLARDKNTGVILNINTDEIREAKKRKRLWKQQQEELDSLKSDVKEIKSLLGKILEATNGNNND